MPSVVAADSLPPEETLESHDLETLLDGLKLRKMAEVLPREISRAMGHGSSYRTFLARLLREEFQTRKEATIQRRIKAAKIPEAWSLTTFPWSLQPGIRRAAIEELASLEFLARGQNLVFQGEPGVGKTGLATGLLLSALQAGYTGTFIRAQDLFDEIYASLADRSSRHCLDRLARFDFLLIDEMGYLVLRPEQSNLFFRLMDDRYTRRKATVITTNLDFDGWYDFLKNKAMVSALLDRFRHRCTSIPITGPSIRGRSAQPSRPPQ